MNDFLKSLQDWQLFYATVAASSATLTGLLFVSLSLNRKKFNDNEHRNNLLKARNTFSNFLYILMIAFVFLVPHQVPYSLTVSLVVLGLSRAIGLIRSIAINQTSDIKQGGRHIVIREILLPLIASAGLVLVGIEVLFGNYNFIYWLVGVIAAILISACWNAWLLLVEI
jgi:hypothetical protein